METITLNPKKQLEDKGSMVLLVDNDLQVGLTASIPGFCPCHADALRLFEGHGVEPYEVSKNLIMVEVAPPTFLWPRSPPGINPIMLKFFCLSKYRPNGSTTQQSRSSPIAPYTSPQSPYHDAPWLPEAASGHFGHLKALQKNPLVHRRAGAAVALCSIHETYTIVDTKVLV
jgi:hypothetical protein